MKPYDVVKSEVVYTGKIINVKSDIVIMEDGKEAVRELVVHGGASAVVPIDQDGNIIFVRQYRHATGQKVLEIPAGTLEKGEDPQVCAVRELEEETGYKAGKIVFMNKMYSAIGFCTEVLYIYVAEDLTEGVQALDDDEYVTVEKYSIAEAVDKIFNGEIIDSKTIAAVLACKELLARRK